MQLQQTLDEIIRVVENNPEFWSSDNLTGSQKLLLPTYP